MTTETLNRQRKKAEALLEKAAEPEIVKNAILEMETSLRAELPPKTLDALEMGQSVRRDSLYNLIWALRSEMMLKFRQKTDPVGSCIAGVSSEQKPKQQRKLGEVDFERRLVREAESSSCWANQLVVWSGIAGDGHTLKRAVIDLCFRESSSSFELYELKVNAKAGAQSWALTELASYAIGYFLCRTLFSSWNRPDVKEEVAKLRKRNELDPKHIGYLDKGHLLKTPECELLNATQLKWILVAPKDYFEWGLESPEKSQILSDGFDLYLADVRSRPGFEALSMGCSIKAMEFNIGNWETEAKGSLEKFVRGATARFDS